MLIDRRLLSNLDHALLVAVVIAVLFGCAMIYSATRWNTRLTAGNPLLYVKKQLARCGVGGCCVISCPQCGLSLLGTVCQVDLPG